MLFWRDIAAEFEVKGGQGSQGMVLSSFITDHDVLAPAR